MVMVTPGGFLVLFASPPLVLGKATTTNWGPRLLFSGARRSLELLPVGAIRRMTGRAPGEPARCASPDSAPTWPATHRSCGWPGRTLRAGSEGPPSERR